MQKTDMGQFDRDPFGTKKIAEIMAELAKKRSNYIESLKGVPYKSQVISAKDFENLQKIEVFLEAVRSWYDEEVIKLESIYGKEGCINRKAFVWEKQTIEDEAFDKALQAVDKLNIWSYKFSTMCGAGINDPLVCSPKDSIYFITPYGVSLRFKRANKGKGIREIILLFTEKIFFRKDNDLIEVPKKGYYVYEYVTQEFLALIGWEQPVKNDYRSQIRKYIRKNRVEIPKLDNSLYHHEGHPVNWIEER